MSGAAVQRKLGFGPFTLSIGERVLRRDGRVLPLGDRALEILICLVDRPGEVIAKQELIDHVWPEVTVEEGSLRVHMAAIRKALGDGQFGNRYIANIKGRGYSFVGTVVLLPSSMESRDDSYRHQGGLPVRPLLMVGRESVITQVADNLRYQRFVTLLGPGGIGKTTIALAVGRAAAREFDGKVHFVDLESLTNPDHVIGALANSLGFPLKSKESRLELIDFVRSRKLLIILDSCEHVIEAVALLAEQLYQETESVHLLTTSRELLKVEGEHGYRVLPLEFPPDGSEQTAHAVLRYPAAQLLVRRVAARAGSFVLKDEEAPLVVEMCRKLDGIPLAIELAAGQVAALGLKDTVSRLVSRIEMLKLSHRTAISRHRTLKATLDWSHDLLSEAEKIVFRRIAPFVGNFTLEGARYVAAEPSEDNGEIFDALVGLVEKSLIATQPDKGETRYRLLDTTRAYALGKLEEHDELDSVSLRHAEYVIEQLESQKATTSALPRPEKVAVYSRQLSNVRSALEWSFGSPGNGEVATRLAVASTQLFVELPLLNEWQTWAEQAIAWLEDQHKDFRRETEIVASLPATSTSTQASNRSVNRASSRTLDVALVQQDLAHELKLLSGLFLYSSWTTDIYRALDIAARSRKVALRTQDPDDLAHAEAMLGSANHLAGNHLVAQRHFEAGLRHLSSGPRLRDGHHLFHHPTLLLAGMARSLLYRGVLDQSLNYASLAVEEGKKSGRPPTLCRLLILILPVYLVLEDWQTSEEHIAQLADLSAAHSLKQFSTIATGLRGRWLLLQNNIHDGVPLLKRASEELEAQRQEMLNMDFVADLGAGLAASGQHEEALRLVVNALDVQKRGGKFLFMPALMRVKGLILASRSAEDLPEAESSLLSAIDWAKRQAATLFELKAAMDLSELFLKQGRLSEANRYLSAAVDRMPAEILFPAHERAVQLLNRLQSGSEAVG